MNKPAANSIPHPPKRERIIGQPSIAELRRRVQARRERIAPAPTKPSHASN